MAFDQTVFLNPTRQVPSPPPPPPTDRDTEAGLGLVGWLSPGPWGGQPCSPAQLLPPQARRRRQARQPVLGPRGTGGSCPTAGVAGDHGTAQHCGTH